MWSRCRSQHIVYSALLVLSCASQEPARPARSTMAGDGIFAIEPGRGYRRDVHTSPGEQGGYSVQLSCDTAPNGIAVRGPGLESSGKSEGAGSHGDAIREVAKEANIGSVEGVGVGMGCDSDPAMRAAGIPGGTSAAWLILSDWRDVDATIAAVGAWLVRENLSLEVLIKVEQMKPTTAPNQ